jgi:hypothetical protein
MLNPNQLCEHLKKSPDYQIDKKTSADVTVAEVL